MFEGEQPRVQGLTGKRLDGGSHFRGQRMRLGEKPRAVNAVADQWMPDMGEVNTNLVGPPGLQAAAEKGCGASERFADLIMGECPSAAGPHHRLLLTVLCIAMEGSVD